MSHRALNTDNFRSKYGNNQPNSWRANSNNQKTIDSFLSQTVTTLQASRLGKRLNAKFLPHMGYIVKDLHNFSLKTCQGLLLLQI